MEETNTNVREQNSSLKIHENISCWVQLKQKPISGFDGNLKQNMCLENNIEMEECQFLFADDDTGNMFSFHAKTTTKSD